jgi:SagB-type dehydrogenase family enzyme
MTVEIRFGRADGAVLRGDRGQAWFAAENAQSFPLPHDWIAEVSAVSTHELSVPGIEALLAASDKLHRRTEFFAWLNILIDRGLLRSFLIEDGHVLASRVGIGMRSPPACAAHQGSFRLSKFTYSRVINEELVVEAAISASRIILHDPRAAAAFCSFSTPLRIASDAASTGDAAVVIALATMLIDAGMMVDTELPREPEWEFHDLLFQTWSRYGQVMLPYGRSSCVAPPTSQTPTMEHSNLVRLPIPRGEEGLAFVSLAQILEARRSVRTYGQTLISLQQLGLFLYRCAARRTNSPGEGSSYPYPSPGGRYPLRIHLILRCCAGVDPGLYSYDALGHQLLRRRGYDEHVERMLGDYAELADLQSANPQVLFVITTHHSQVADYLRMALANTLKEVGALYQTMYLVATAMGLAPCAIGGGNSQVFAALAGIDAAESVIGEFMLGIPQ